MANADVAALARQLRQDGIDAARAEAERILAEAREQAAAILREAEATAARITAEARTEIAQERERFGTEMDLMVRDAVLDARKRIELVVLRLLRAKIAGALAAEDVVKAALHELIKNPAPGNEWEVGVGPRLGKALVEAAVSDLFKGREAFIALVEEFGNTGLEFRTAGGTEALELSEESVAEVFRQMMSPELRRLIDSLAD